MEVLESAPSDALKGRRQDYLQQMPSSNIVAKWSLEDWVVVCAFSCLLVWLGITRCLGEWLPKSFQGKFGGINLSAPAISADGGVNTTSYKHFILGFISKACGILANWSGNGYDPIILTDAKKVLTGYVAVSFLTILTDSDWSMQSARKRLPERSVHETMHEKHVQHGLKESK